MNKHVQPDISGAALPCLNGKLVQINGRGVGRVTGTSEGLPRQYRINIFNEPPNNEKLEMLFPPHSLEIITLPCDDVFEAGQHARHRHGIVYIIGGGASGYGVSIRRATRNSFVMLTN